MDLEQLPEEELKIALTTKTVVTKWVGSQKNSTTEQSTTE